MAFEAQLVEGEYQANSNYLAGADAAVGEIVAHGDRVVIIHPYAIANGAVGAVAVGGGIWRIAKDGTSGPAFSIGEEVFWDASNNEAVKTASGNKHIGTCAVAAGANQAWVDTYFDPDGNST